jgi:2-isopropylmalate synthase
MVKIAWEGRHWNGRGVSTDVLESSIKAYLSAINAMEWDLAAGAAKSPLRSPLKEGGV